MVDKEKDISALEWAWEIRKENKNTIHNIDEIVGNKQEIWGLQEEVIAGAIRHDDNEAINISQETQYELLSIKENIEQQHEKENTLSTKNERKKIDMMTSQQNQYEQTEFTYPTLETIQQNKLAAADRVTKTVQDLTKIDKPNWFMRSMISAVQRMWNKAS